LSWGADGAGSWGEDRRSAARADCGVGWGAGVAVWRETRRGVREDQDLGFFLGPLMGFSSLWRTQFGTNFGPFSKPRKIPNLLGRFGSKES
jgi:hypothetical protein